MAKKVTLPDRCSDCSLNNRCRYDCGTQSCIRKYNRYYDRTLKQERAKYARNN